MCYVNLQCVMDKSDQVENGKDTNIGRYLCNKWLHVSMIFCDKNGKRFKA